MTEDAAQAQLAAVGRLLAVEWDQLPSQLQAITQPVLYANGVHDVMIPAAASYKAVEQVPDATLVLHSDAGHAFLFQHIDEFAAR